MAVCDELRQQMLLELRRDAAAHERGDYAALGAGYKSFCAMPGWAACEEDEDASHRLTIAENFWDRWQDARNHDWGYYPGIERDDWPVIARQLCDGVEKGLPPDELRTIARVWDLESRPPFWVGWWNALRRKA